jgi:hypothetical protein
MEKSALKFSKISGQNIPADELFPRPRAFPDCEHKGSTASFGKNGFRGAALGHL